MNKTRISGLGACVAFLTVLSVAPGCLTSEEEEPGATGGAGTSGGAGTTGTAGTTGSAGTTGTAGTKGGAGTTGTAGTSAAAGTTGSAGTTGVAGTQGGAGTTGAAGSNGAAGTTGAAGTNGAAGTGAGGPVTFTMIYDQILDTTPTSIASSCSGGACHNAPGGGKGIEHIDMNTKASAYTGVKKFVVVGNPAGSKFFTEVNTGAMPEGRPKLSPAQIKMISDWIMAGAKND